MTHFISSLCLRDGLCVHACPADCIVKGEPQLIWPWYYIDPLSCIDCGACSQKCPYDAIFTRDQIPLQMKITQNVIQSMPEGTSGFDQPYNIIDFSGKTITLMATRTIVSGQTIDLTADMQTNIDFFEKGPGYQVDN
jgi:NAD-dependent dihydropyrimidine dehydrogenase PreA subunit